MRGWSTGLPLGAVVLCGLAACSASSPHSASPVAGQPSTGTAGTAVSNSTGGQVSGTTGGTGPELMLGPTGGTDANGGEAPVDPGVCDDLSIQTYEAVPTVLLLVDTSSSMFDERAKLWDPLFKALMDSTTGVVANLQSKVRFGFASYKSVTRPAGAAMCPLLVSTDLKIDNYETIQTQYAAAGVTPTTDFKWETPTGASVAAVAKTLSEFQPEPAGPKFLLLVTDGDPDTCAVRDPQCGQDDSIKAVQDAYAAGIGTFVIGIGDILTSTNGSMRVGKDHLQDIANAGKGLPVAANSLEYSYSACVKDTGLTATYATEAETPGTAPYYTVSAADPTTAQTQIADAIIASLEQTRSCTFNMDAQVNGDASLGTLTLDGNSLPFGDADGWSLGTDLISVTLNGSACDTWKTKGGKVNVVFPCKLVPVERVPVKPPK